MNQKRLIITSLISVILVSFLYMGKTFSVYTTSAPDEETNVYKTGNLDIEIIGQDEPIKNILPTNEELSDKLSPYRISVINKGTVPYKFNVILEETTSSNKIDKKYIITKVGKLDSISLSNCKDNIIKEGIIVLPNETTDIDVRIWISDKVPNTEMNKSFFAKIKIDGVATQSKNNKIDNSSLINPLEIITQENQTDENQQPDNTETEELPQ